MASIQKLRRKSGTRYRVQVRKKGERPISRVFDRLSDARAWAEHMGDAGKRAAVPTLEAQRHTVADVIDQYMLDYSGRDSSIVGRLSWWKAEYGSVPLSQFTTATVKEGLRRLSRAPAQRFVSKKKGEVSLGRPRGPATVNRYKAAIRVAMQWAIAEDWITDNPAKGIKSKKEPRGVERFLSEDECKELLEACDEAEWPDLGLLVRLALSTGARQGELLGLRWSDLNADFTLASLRQTKSGKPRMLPLIDPVRKRLKARAAELREQKVTDLRSWRDRLIFASPRDPQRPFSFRRHWEAALEAAEITSFRFHDLRHTAASYLAMSGASDLEIADVLGHSTLAMVKRYSHLRTEHKERLVARVFEDTIK